METMQNINETNGLNLEEQAEQILKEIAVPPNPQVVAALDKNERLCPIRVEIENMVTRFSLCYPNVSLDNLCRRLKTVKVVGGSKYAYVAPMQYLPATNEIVIVKDRLDEVDTHHSMMKIVLSMITANGKNFGFNSNDKLLALNMAFLESFATLLYGNDDEYYYADEYRLLNLIAPEIDESIITAFLQNKPDLLMKNLLAICHTPEKLDEWLNLMNYNMLTRKVTGESILFDLEKGAVEMFPIDTDYLQNRNLLPQTLENTKTI